jgi:hypothetical protein
MAAREGQGLQIAVIIFAMLTILLAITTYMFYAQASTAAREKEAATKQLNDERATNNKLMYRVLAMKYVLGMPGVTMQEVDLQKGKVGGDDQEVTDILTRFNSDMAAVGDQVGEGETKSYGGLVKALFAAVQRKHASAADAIQQSKQAQTDKDATAKREKDRADTAEANATKSQSQLDAELAKYNEDRAKLTKTNEQLQADLDAKAKTTKVAIDDAAKKADKASTEAKQLQTTVDFQEQRIFQLNRELGKETDPLDKPDGRIVHVNQAQKRAWIDLGKADGLTRQMSFSVFDQGLTAVANAKPKARIEVVQISDDHMAEARIVQDKVSDLIQPGDVVFTPAWSPGEHVRFALCGKMDIDGDRLDDYDLIRNVISLNGGVIDAELRPDGTRTGTISVNTRYLVLGEAPDVSADNPNAQNAINAYSETVKEAERHAVLKRSPKELLVMMGWKSEERTIPLSGSRGGAFQKRGPGKAEPGAASTGAPTGAANPTTDAGTAPATQPAAGQPVDPFAAPPAGAAPMPTRPAPDADPFAAPPPR